MCFHGYFSPFYYCTDVSRDWLQLGNIESHRHCGAQWSNRGKPDNRFEYFCSLNVRWTATDGGERQNLRVSHWQPPARQRLKPGLQLGLAPNSRRGTLTFRAQQRCQVPLCHAVLCCAMLCRAEPGWAGQPRCLCSHWERSRRPVTAL